MIEIIISLLFLSVALTIYVMNKVRDKQGKKLLAEDKVVRIIRKIRRRK